MTGQHRDEAVIAKISLNDQVGYSTIHLEFYLELEHQAAPGRGFWSKVLDGLEGGWDFLKLLAIGVAYLWPLWAVVAVMVRERPSGLVAVGGCTLAKRV